MDEAARQSVALGDGRPAHCMPNYLLRLDQPASCPYPVSLMRCRENMQERAGYCVRTSGTRPGDWQEAPRATAGNATLASECILGADSGLQ